MFYKFGKSFVQLKNNWKNIFSRNFQKYFICDVNSYEFVQKSTFQIIRLMQCA